MKFYFQKEGIKQVIALLWLDLFLLLCDKKYSLKNDKRYPI